MNWMEKTWFVNWIPKNSGNPIAHFSRKQCGLCSMTKVLVNGIDFCTLCD